MPLNLSVPAPEQRTTLAVETRVDQVSAWLEKLLRGIPADAALAVCDAIAALNHHPLAASERLVLLERYRAAALELLPPLKAQFVIVPLPLPEKNRRIAELNRQLFVELANGYKIVLQDTLKEAGRTPLLAVQRGIASLGNVIATCYESYAPVPVGTWAEIHQLYRHAQHENLLDEPVQDGAASTSVADSFKQVLLLAVTDPYHLMQGEVIRVVDYTGRFARFAELRTDSGASGQGGIFLVSLDGDQPPKALPKMVSEVDGATAILLDTSRLTAQLSQQLGGLDAGITPADLLLPEAARDQAYRGLMKRLLKHWSLSVRRHFNRKHYRAELDICVGVRAIHYFLSGQQVYGVGSGASNGDLDFSPHKNVFVSSRWSILNESAGGMALTQVSEIYPQLRAGEIIGLKAEGSLRWNIAVVRWVKTNERNRLDLGIQMVAPYATAAAVRPAGTHTPFQPVLLLPEIPLFKQPPCVVAPRGMLQAQRGFVLEHEGQTTSQKASQLLESTAVFEQFQFAAE
ncbi:MAG: hypothetical protein KGZ83_11005 [Sulfuricella sp.]|nr:hypothetical protein [Sulfuricella sp.]